MRAIRVHEFGAPDVMRLEDVPPPTAGAGQVLVRIEAAGVNPVETYVRAGIYSELPALPYTPGADGAGVRADTNQRVYVAGSVSGTYAEVAVCRADQVHALPAELTYAQGAALGTPYVAAYRALFQRAQASPGQRALIHGASGGVGLAAVQLAVAAGIHVTATAGSAAGRLLAAAQGAEIVLDHHDAAHLTAAVAHTSGRGFDVILEILASTNLGQDLRALAARGTVVVVGSRGLVEVDPRDLMNADGAILGMRLPNATGDELAAAHRAIGRGLRDGTLRPVIEAELPLADAPQAHRALMDGPALGKLVLRP